MTGPPPAVGDIGLLVVRLDYHSHHPEEARRFYAEVLGLRDAEVDPATDSVVIRTGPGSSLGFMPPSDGPPEEWRPPREPQITLMVEDVDRAHALLVQRGVEFLEPPTDTPRKQRVARLRDPEGRMVCLATRREREG